MTPRSSHSEELITMTYQFFEGEITARELIEAARDKQLWLFKKDKHREAPSPLSSPPRGEGMK